MVNITLIKSFNMIYRYARIVIAIIVLYLTISLPINNTYELARGREDLDYWYGVIVQYMIWIAILFGIQLFLSKTNENFKKEYGNQIKRIMGIISAYNGEITIQKLSQMLNISQEDLLNIIGEVNVKKRIFTIDKNDRIKLEEKGQYNVDKEIEQVRKYLEKLEKAYENKEIDEKIYQRLKEEYVKKLKDLKNMEERRQKQIKI